MKIKEECFLTKDEIRVFITANVLHAIDRKLVSEDFADIDFNVEEKPDKFIVSLISAHVPEGACKEYMAGCDIPKTAESYQCHLRMMMGAAMVILEDLFKRHPKDPKAPVLHVIKGGLDG